MSFNFAPRKKELENFLDKVEHVTEAYARKLPLYCKSTTLASVILSVNFICRTKLLFTLFVIPLSYFSYRDSVQCTGVVAYPRNISYWAPP